MSSQNKQAGDDDETSHLVALPVQLVDDDADDPSPDNFQFPDWTTVQSSSSSTAILPLAVNKSERRVLDVLQNVQKALEEQVISLPNNNNGGKHKQKVTIRIAGGWVRDKCLAAARPASSSKNASSASSSPDIDVAVDICSGVEFAQTVHSFLMSQTTSEENKICSSKIGIIAANPQQSKHLETATFRIYDVHVDFAQLRKEDSDAYAHDSRIPQIGVGTPRQDALRRDFTMNALFYNLTAHQLEDWNDGRGFYDLLTTRTIHTPLPAETTLAEDPLRLLRAIRFGVRLDLQMGDEIRRVARTPSIHQALHRKVSRERVGKELQGMLDAQPSTALHWMLEDLHLAGAVFPFPVHGPIWGEIGLKTAVPYAQQSEVDGMDVEYSNNNKNNKPTADPPFGAPVLSHDDEKLAHLRSLAWKESSALIRLLDSILKLKDNPIVSLNSQDCKEQRGLTFLAVALLPFGSLTTHEETAKKSKIAPKMQSVVDWMIRQGIKFKNSQANWLKKVWQGAKDFESLLEHTDQQLQAGLIVRSLKEDWRIALLVAIVKAIYLEEKSFALEDNISSEHAMLNRARHLVSKIVSDWSLQDCWKRSPLLNGKDLITDIGINRGPQVGKYNQMQIEWMLVHPTGSRAELVEHLRNVRRQEEREEDVAAQHVSKKMHLS